MSLPHSQPGSAAEATARLNERIWREQVRREAALFGYQQRIITTVPKPVDSWWEEH